MVDHLTQFKPMVYGRSAPSTRSICPGQTGPATPKLWSQSRMPSEIKPTTNGRVSRLSNARLPTRIGTFDAVAFSDSRSGTEPIALVHGDVAARDAPLVRLHSECWTGDVLGSLRCDCGEQLGRALTAIVAEGAGVLIYLRQEGRGIGLANKLRAYALQDGGLDTVAANAALGLPVDAREYGAAAAILADLGLEQVRLMTNNPSKIAALEAHGIRVSERVPLPALPNPVNWPYLETKAARLGHVQPRKAARPSVTVHYAQTIDGRLATRTGDSQWISGQESLVLAHALRASHAAVLVGAGTVAADDPRLTARLVEGPSPVRVVLDSKLRLSPRANVVTDGAAPTILATTDLAPLDRRREFARRAVEVLVLPCHHRRSGRSRVAPRRAGGQRHGHPARGRRSQRDHGDDPRTPGESAGRVDRAAGPRRRDRGRR